RNCAALDCVTNPTAVLYDGALPAEVVPAITGTTVVTVGIVASGFQNARTIDDVLTRSLAERLGTDMVPRVAMPTTEPPPESTLMSHRAAGVTLMRFMP